MAVSSVLQCGASDALMQAFLNAAREQRYEDAEQFGAAILRAEPENSLVKEFMPLFPILMRKAETVVDESDEEDGEHELEKIVCAH